MKIGITCYPTYGGSGIIATELGMALAKKGVEVHFISSTVPVRLRHFYENVYFHKVQGLPYPLFDHPPYTLNLTNQMVHVVRTYGLDVLHVHYAIPHSVSACLARDIVERDVKVVTTLHGTDILLIGQDESYFDITKHAMNESNLCTAVSDYLAEETHRIFNVRTPIRVIKNFVDTDVFYPKREGEGKGKSVFSLNGEKVLLHISNFREVKRIETLIKAFALIRKRVAARLVLVGEGPETQKAERMVARLGLEACVLFLGQQDCVGEILREADVFLLSSRIESFGLVILEAMASGLPVVATDCGGPKELIRDGENGFLIPVDDHEAMAARVQTLLADNALHARFSENAYNDVLSAFTIDSILPAYIAAYEEALRG